MIVAETPQEIRAILDKGKPSKHNIEAFADKAPPTHLLGVKELLIYVIGLCDTLNLLTVKWRLILVRQWNVFTQRANFHISC